MSNLDEMIALTDGMDLPVRRRDDARWILRNAAVRNFDHPNIRKLLTAARNVMRDGTREDVAECGCRVEMGYTVEICRDVEVAEVAATLALDAGDHAKYQKAWDIVLEHRQRVTEQTAKK